MSDDKSTTVHTKLWNEMELLRAENDGLSAMLGWKRLVSVTDDAASEVGSLELHALHAQNSIVQLLQRAAQAVRENDHMIKGLKKEERRDLYRRESVQLREHFDAIHAELDAFGVTTGGTPLHRLQRLLERVKEDRKALIDARTEVIKLRNEAGVRHPTHPCPFSEGQAVEWFDENREGVYHPAVVLNVKHMFDDRWIVKTKLEGADDVVRTFTNTGDGVWRCGRMHLRAV